MTNPPPRQRCPACGALAEYEGHDDRPSSLTRHRFHCHSCGRVYLLQSTSHKPPVFAIQPRHEIQEETSH